MLVIAERLPLYFGTLATLLLGSCAGRGTEAEVARFLGPDGRTIVLSRAGHATAYDLAVRGAPYPPQRLRRLDGLEGIAVTPAVEANGNSLVLITGHAPGCPHRTVFLATRPPRTETHAIPGCDKQFAIATQRNGRDVIVREARSSPSQVYYVYRDGALSAPEPEPKTAVGRPSRLRAPIARGEAPVGPGGPEGSLPAPATRTGINLDE